MVADNGLYQPLKFLERIRKSEEWDFDSAIIVQALGPGSEVSIIERDGSRSSGCGNGLLAVGYVLDLLGRERRVLMGSQLICIRRVSDSVYRVPMGKAYRVGRFSPDGTEFVLPQYYIQGELHVVSVNATVHELEALGRAITPVANVTMVAFRNAGEIAAQTYERGVNRITQSSGTGACAAVQACRDMNLPLSGCVKVQMNHPQPLIIAGDSTGMVLEGSVALTGEMQEER
jgi:diaminopimelate epimerase